MIRNAENDFGHNLHVMVTHLIKSAHKIPAPVVQFAQAFEDRAWQDLDDNAKRERLREVAKHTEEPSPIHRHFESFPHAFSKNQYADYLASLKRYKEFLGVL